MAPQLDHIIILLPYDALLNPPDWLTSQFNILSGGRHADNKTENKLIVFRDGIYLELIAFINDLPAHRADHWWGQKTSGLIDWALTSLHPDDVHATQAQLAAVQSSEHASMKVGYDPAQEGGRLRPDGRTIKWKVTFPAGVERGQVPFWCHDLTPRELRVPADASVVTHPCGAVGIASVELSVKEGCFDEIRRIYDALLGKVGVEADSDSVTWTIDSPASGGGATGFPKISMRKRTGDQSGAADVILSGFSVLSPASDGSSQYIMNAISGEAFQI